MSYRARVVDGHVVRDGRSGSSSGQFSVSRFLVVVAVVSVLIVTNPANGLLDKASQLWDRDNDNRSGWAWDQMLDPPLSVTNYGIFTVEERHAKLKFVGLTQQLWSCSYFDEQTGSFCSSLARNLCHGKPLLHHRKEKAYTAHRIICYTLIACSLLSFCYGGSFPAPWAAEPLFGAILNTFGRAHFSLFSLAFDLFNAGMHVYPALVRMEHIVATLQDRAVASSLGLPTYVDYIFYVVVLVLFVGGGANALASHFSRHACLGFDSTVAAAAGYCSALSSSSSGGGGMLAPQTVLWAGMPVSAVLGGSTLAWILGGMLGVALAQYHLENQDPLLSLQQSIQSIFAAFR